MTRLVHDLPQTTFSWCPTTPILATVADNDNRSQLELFQIGSNASGTTQTSLGKASTSSRVHALAWGDLQMTNSWGILAAGTENGGLEIWDPWAIAGDSSSTLLHETKTSSRRVIRMDFNRNQKNLLATACNDNDVAVWDLSHGLGRPYKAGGSLGAADEMVTNLSWNNHVPHILSLSYTSGRVSILDLRSRSREIIVLQGDHYVSSMAWHPDMATHLVSASDDDHSPHILSWDLRHAQKPERTLQGHTKGVTDVSWCRQDSDVLVSSAKDGKLIGWNPKLGSSIEVANTNAGHHALQVEFCPRNPNWLASWNLGDIYIWTIPHDQRTAENSIVDDNNNAIPTSQKSPPKWLRRPVGATFSFGGRLVVFSSKTPSSHGHPSQPLPKQRLVVHTFHDTTLTQRMLDLEATRSDQQQRLKLLNRHCTPSQHDPSSLDAYDWPVLQCLFSSTPRQALLEFLGLDPTKTTTADLVGKATKSAAPYRPSGHNSKVLSPPVSPGYDDNSASPRPFFNPARYDSRGDAGVADSLSGIFPAAASTQEAPMHDDAHFFADQSTTTTAQAASAYASSALDKQITLALAVGNLDLAVDLCLQDDHRAADALVLAFSGSQNLINKTRRAYLERRAHVPYLQLLDSVTRQDLTSYVQNCHVDDWRTVLSVLCAYAPPAHLVSLCDLLGQRLETAATTYLASTTLLDTDGADPQQWLRQARVCYMMAGKSNRVLALWLAEWESQYRLTGKANVLLGPNQQAMLLVTLMEKITLLFAAFDHQSQSLEDLLLSASPNTASTTSPESIAVTDQLHAKYADYAHLLAFHGHLDLAFKYVEMIPSHSRDVLVLRHRLYEAMGANGPLVALKPPKYPFDRQHHVVASSPLHGFAQHLSFAIDPSAQHYPHQQPSHDLHLQQEGLEDDDDDLPGMLPTPMPQRRPPFVDPQQQRRYHRLSRQLSTDVFGHQSSPPNPWNREDVSRDILHFDPIQYRPPGLFQEESFFDSLTAPFRQPAAPPQPLQHQRPYQQMPYPRQHLQGLYIDPDDNEYYADADDRHDGSFDHDEHPSFFDSPTPVGPPTAQQVAEANRARAAPFYPLPHQQPPQPPTYPYQHQTSPSQAASDQSMSTPFQQERSPRHLQQQQHPWGSPTMPTGHYPENNSSPQRDRDRLVYLGQPDQGARLPMNHDDRSSKRYAYVHIMQVFTKILPSSRQHMEPMQRKQWDDVEKRLNGLFDQLQQNELKDDVVQSLLKLVQALSEGNHDQATTIHAQLLTSNIECSSWLLAVIRLIEYDKHS